MTSFLILIFFHKIVSFSYNVRKTVKINYIFVNHQLVLRAKEYFYHRTLKKLWLNVKIIRALLLVSI